LFSSQAWNQVKTRFQFLVDHHGAGLLTGEVGSGKSTAVRSFSAGLNANLFKVMYLHWTPGSALDLLRQVALELDLEPAHYRGDLARQISQAIVVSIRAKSSTPHSGPRTFSTGHPLVNTQSSRENAAAQCMDERRKHPNRRLNPLFATTFRPSEGFLVSD